MTLSEFLEHTHAFPAEEVRHITSAVLATSRPPRTRQQFSDLYIAVCEQLTHDQTVIPSDPVVAA